MNILPKEQKQKLEKIFSHRVFAVMFFWLAFVLFVFAVLAAMWLSFLRISLQEEKKVMSAKEKSAQTPQITRMDSDAALKHLLQAKSKYRPISFVYQDIKSAFDNFQNQIFITSISISRQAQSGVYKIIINARSTNKEALLALIKTLKNKEAVQNLDVSSVISSLSFNKDGSVSFVLKFDYVQLSK